jgi:hypothetical protein
VNILLLTLTLSLSAVSYAQVWKTLPKGVRIAGYRNVTSSQINSNFSSLGERGSLGREFKLDAHTFNELAGNVITPGSDVDSEAYNNLIVGEYEINASAQVKAHGTGLGWGLTDKVMFYAQIAYYEINVKSKIKRTAGNTYEETANILEENGGTENIVLAENLRHMFDADESTIQSVVTNYYGYRPIGDWTGKGYGDLETGLMINLADEGSTGLMIYPGIVAPTGFQDDPDILQDIAFGDGQFDLFAEIATGYLYNDHFMLGTTLRYTYQAPGTKRIRIPSDNDFTLTDQIDEVDFKLGDRIDWMLNSTFSFNDWLSITPSYRFSYQSKSKYFTENTLSNTYLSNNSDRLEHLGQVTTTISSIAPFLKKSFPLPAQLNLSYAKTLSGKNVPDASRVEIEIRMLF